MKIETRFADYRDPASFAKLIDSKTKAIFCESVGNPLGNITDIAALAKVAHEAGVPLIVDNTAGATRALAASAPWRVGGQRARC